ELLTEDVNVTPFKITSQGTVFEKVGIFCDAFLNSLQSNVPGVIVDIQTPLNLVRRPDYSTLIDRDFLPGNVNFLETSFHGFFNGLKVINGQEMRIFNCRFGAAVGDALYYSNEINVDGGDSSILSTDFHSLWYNSPNAIRQLSGG